MRKAMLAAVLLLAVGTAPAQGAIAIRKDVKDMTAAEKKAFVDAVIKVKNTKSPFGKNGISFYDLFVYYHRRVNNLPVDGAHGGPAFLPWHREFLYAFEAVLIEYSKDENIAIPYWDWTNPASTRAVFGRDMMGGDGDPRRHHAVVNGPFRKGSWHIDVPEQLGSKNPFVPQIDQVADHPYIQRAMGWTSRIGSPSQLPTAAEMDRVMGSRSTTASRGAASPTRASRSAARWRAGVGRASATSIGRRAQPGPPVDRWRVGRAGRHPARHDDRRRVTQRPDLLADPLEHRAPLAEVAGAARPGLRAGPRRRPRPQPP